MRRGEGGRGRGGEGGRTYDAGVVDEVVDALVPHDLRCLARRVRDRLGVAHVEAEDVQPPARGRCERIQGVGFRRVAAGGENGVVGRLEELLRDLEADSAASPVDDLKMKAD